MQIFGQVSRHVDHLPLADVEVIVWDAKERKEVTRGKSVEGGSWEVSVPSSGMYLFEFRKDGFQVNALHASIPENERVAFDPVVLKPMVSGIGMTVYKEGDAVAWSDEVLDDRHRPLLDVQVQAYLPNQDILVAEAMTGVDGKFRLMLKPGKYDIIYYKFGWNQNAPSKAVLELGEDGKSTVTQEGGLNAAHISS